MLSLTDRIVRLRTAGIVTCLFRPSCIWSRSVGLLWTKKRAVGRPRPYRYEGTGNPQGGTANAQHLRGRRRLHLLRAKCPTLRVAQRNSVRCSYTNRVWGNDGPKAEPESRHDMVTNSCRTTLRWVRSTLPNLMEQGRRRNTSGFIPKGRPAGRSACSCSTGFISRSLAASAPLLMGLPLSGG